MSLNLENTTLELQTTTAVVDENGELRGLEPLPALKGRRVQIVVVSEKTATFETSEISETMWHRGIVSNPAFAFLKDEAENIYSWEDGTALPPLRADVKSP